MKPIYRFISQMILLYFCTLIVALFFLLWLTRPAKTPSQTDLPNEALFADEMKRDLSG